MGKTTGATTFPLVVTNIGSTNLFNVRDDGNVGINVTNPGYRLSVFEAANTTAAIYASQGTAASSAGAHGVYGLSANSNTAASGVRGENSNAGPAVSGFKTSTAGSAGRFEISNSGNNADALFATTPGLGAAIHAVNGPTVAGSSNVSLWMEAGHLKSTQVTAPTTTTLSVSGGGISGVSLTLGGGSTDVKGVMNVILTTTLLINSTNNATVRVNFNKAYQNAPVVTVTSLSDLGLLTYYVSNVTTTSFNLTIRNSTAGNMSSGASFPLNFNYMVIE